MSAWLSASLLIAQEFDGKWKQMKQGEASPGTSVVYQAERWPLPAGKNRPLDEEELQFLDSVAEAEAAK